VKESEDGFGVGFEDAAPLGLEERDGERERDEDAEGLEGDGEALPAGALAGEESEGENDEDESGADREGPRFGVEDEGFGCGGHLGEGQIVTV
jgi:hypothetical protein